MDITEELFKLLMFILPALLVFLTAFYMLKRFFENEEKKRIMEMRKQSHSATIPMKLQAYERLVLFLERIALESLLVRVHRNDISARIFQAELLTSIRSEFEHNVSQQIYISKNAWELIKHAKEEVIKIINIASGNVKDDADSVTLSKTILDITAKIEKSPTQTAIDYLKEEVRKNY